VARVTIDGTSAHVFQPGACGRGVTTTVTRLVDRALACGSGVVIIDSKTAAPGTGAGPLTGAR
jgi:hypothetical protein